MLYICIFPKIRLFNLQTKLDFKRKKVQKVFKFNMRRKSSVFINANHNLTMKVKLRLKYSGDEDDFQLTSLCCIELILLCY